MAVVDAFDALIQGRPYQRSRSFREALAEIRDHSGRQFDPKVADAFLKAITPQHLENLIDLSRAGQESSIRALTIDR